MRVLLIDKNLVEAVHRTKWRLLARTPGIDLQAVAPARWRENYRRIECVPLPDDGFPIARLPVGWMGYDNRGFYRGGLAREFRRFDPDVVIAFEEPYSLFAAQCVEAGAALARPVPLILHSWDNLSDRRRFVYRPAFLYRLIERRVMNRAAQLWCANSEAADLYEPAYPGRVRLLPFGLDLDRFSPRALTNPHENPARLSVLYAGRLLAMKGLESLLRAVAALPDGVTLTLVGSGPMQPELERLGQSLAISNRVRFVASIPSEEMADFLAGFDSLVLPSLTTRRWKEQFGKVLVEAMAAGVPVIGSSSGAIPEIIGDAGLIFPEGSFKHLAASIERLLREPALRATLRGRGLERAREFSASLFAARVHDHLRRLVDE